jgi:hypothetical protein
MTALCVIGAVATAARDVLFFGNLVEQARQHGRVAGGIVSHLDGPDF